MAEGAPARSRNAVSRFALAGTVIVGFVAGLAAVTGNLKAIWTDVQGLVSRPASPRVATSSLPRLTLRDAVVQRRDAGLMGASGPIHFVVEVMIEKEGPEEIGCRPQLDYLGRREFGTIIDSRTNTGPRGARLDSFDLPTGLLQRLIYAEFPARIGKNLVREGNVRLACNKLITDWIAVKFVN